MSKTANLSRNKSVLVVDDEEIITSLVSTILTKAGYEVYTCNTGEEALKLASEKGPDLILMDIKMPGLSGYEVTSTLKKDQALANIPVVFLTGKTPDEDAGQSFKSGGATLLRKPIDSQQLKDVVQLCLESD